MVEIIFAALIAAGAAIISALLTNWFADKRFRAQIRGMFYSKFIEFKYEAIKEVYSTMTDCRYTLNYYANFGTKTDKEFREKVRIKVDEYINAKNKAAIWLNPDVLKTLNEVMGIFRTFSMGIFTAMGSKPKFSIDEWEKIDQLYWGATERLKAYSGINSFENYIKRIDKS